MTAIIKNKKSTSYLVDQLDNFPKQIKSEWGNFNLVAWGPYSSGRKVWNGSNWGIEFDVTPLMLEALRESGS